MSPRNRGFKLDQKAPIATVDELADYDAIIFGSGTRFGTVTSQLRNFIDQTGGLWVKGALVGKVGSVIHLIRHPAWRPGIDHPHLHPDPVHQGMVVVGLPYSFQGQMGVDEIKGGSPYGASTITGADGSRQPRRSNSKPPATRASMWPRSPPSSRSKHGH